MMSGPLQLALGRSTPLQYGAAVRRDLRLLEVDEDVLKELQARGGSIKGGSAGDEAVLCTQERTYALKHVQTTNTVLLMPPAAQLAADAEPASGPVVALRANAGRPPWQLGGGNALQDGGAVVRVAGETDHHLEAALAAPRLASLDELLPLYDDSSDAALLGGGSPRDDSTNGAALAGLTFDQLLARVQASEREMRAALQQKGALQLDGRWRRLDPELLGTVLEVLLLSVEQHGWRREAVESDAAAAALQEDGFDPRVVRHCLSLVGSPASAEGGPDGSATSQLWRLDDQKVALHFAGKLLRQRAVWERPQFLAAWRDALPEGVEADEGTLRGVALPEPEDKLRHFPAEALPPGPAERFAALFAARPRWAADDIGPYLDGVQAPGQSKEALLLRYARASQQAGPTGPIIYSAR